MALNPSSIAVVALAAALLPQGSPSPRQLLDLKRPLEAAEISIVLKAVQDAIAGKTFLVSWPGSEYGTRILMGPGGRPRMVQQGSGMVHGVVRGRVPGATTPPTAQTWHEEIMTILSYVGLPARRCDGSVERGEMVIEYTRRGTGEWRASARTETSRDSGITAALSLVQSAERMATGEHRLVDGRSARAIVAPWVTAPVATGLRAAEGAPVIGDPFPNVAGEPIAGVATQSLWIDTVTLLPLRWEVTKPDPATVLQAQVFNYDSFELRPPAGVDAPTCIR